MANKPIAVPKSDLKVLRMFADWSNSFQVFEDERFEVGMYPKNSINHLMVVEGGFNGKVPPPGHYSTKSLKEEGKYVIEEKPFFDEPFIIDPNLDSRELTKFKIPKTGIEEGWDFIISRNGLKNIYITPVNEHTTTYIDLNGRQHQYHSMSMDADDDNYYEPSPLWQNCWFHPSLTIFPKATVNVGRPFLILASFIKALPKIDYRVTLFENHIMDFHSEEHGFNIYLRSWMDEEHKEMDEEHKEPESIRSKEDDWLVGGTKRQVKRFEVIFGKVEQIKIKKTEA